jgi:DNA-binding FadR family transcriptional regulator
VLEPALARLAARRTDHAGLQQLAQAVDEQRALGDDRPRAVQAEGRFHRLMWRLADNQALERAMRDVYLELEAVLDMAMRTTQDTERSLQAHELTLAAIRSGDLDQVDDAMDAHLALMEEIYAQTTGRRFRTF